MRGAARLEGATRSRPDDCLAVYGQSVGRAGGGAATLSMLQTRAPVETERTLPVLRRATDNERREKRQNTRSSIGRRPELREPAGLDPGASSRSDRAARSGSGAAQSDPAERPDARRARTRDLPSARCPCVWIAQRPRHLRSSPRALSFVGLTLLRATASEDPPLRSCRGVVRGAAGGMSGGEVRHHSPAQRRG